MKRLFKLSVADRDGNKSEQEVIAASQFDATINAIQTHSNCVIEVSHIPFDKMTEDQKIKVIDADWNDWERKLRMGVAS